MCDISFPSSIYNIDETSPAIMYTHDVKHQSAGEALADSNTHQQMDNNTVKITNSKNVTVEWHMRHFEPGYYALSDILYQINDVFSNDKKNIISCVYDRSAQRALFKGGPGNIGALMIDRKIARIIGLKQGQFIKCETEKVYAKFKPNVKLYTPRCLYIYTDIIAAQIVGDSNVPLLRAVPIDIKESSTVYEIFIHPYYMPLVKHSFDTIEINIRTSTGELVPFEGGLLNKTLHFRKKQNV